MIDDYAVSRNIARFGLKFKSVIDLCGELGWKNPQGGPISPFLYHKYTITNDQKAREMLALLATPAGQPGPFGHGWGILNQFMASEYRKRFLKEPEKSPAAAAASAPVGRINASEPPGAHIHGWMTGPELAWLHETAKNMSSVVEIGSWQGRSTYALCSSGCPKVVAVDHFLGSPEHQREFGFDHGWSPFPEFEKNILNAFRNVEVRKSDSVDAAREFTENSFDMVFLDGARDYDSVLKDLRAWGSKASRLLAIHSYSHRAVQQAVHEYFNRPPDAVIEDIAAFSIGSS